MNINFHVFVDNFVSAVEAKDAYTAGHSNRVAEISLMIAKKIGLNKETCHLIHVAGHLHDIGKIGIPDGILLKSGKLNEAEFGVMKTHSKIGYNIFKNNKELSEIASIILSHHERFDGGGYPDGIKADVIPLGARIIAVADSFDAMVTKRTYKDKMNIVEAVEELKKHSGKQFDPAVIEAFLDLLRETITRNDILKFVEVI